MSQCSKPFFRFPGIFHEKTTFEEFKETANKFIKKKKTNIMMKKIQLILTLI